MTDPCYASLAEIAAELEGRRLSSVELTRHILARIERLDPDLGSFTTVTTELALAQARQADDERARGIRRSPLHGVPIGIKDLCLTNGVKTLAGMPLRRDLDPELDRDATVVERLREAGAVLVGKQTMTEGATFHHHPDMPSPRNPWRENLWPGVSSSGSAVATAAGLCFASIASDTGGSIRFPSACTGLTGLKPTWGRVSRHGGLDNAPTWDTLGPMARSAEDAAILFDAIVGYDPRDPTSLPQAATTTNAALRGSIDGIRIGVDRVFMHEIEPDVARVTEDAEKTFSALGASIREIVMPDIAPLYHHIVDLQLIELAVVHADTYPAQADRYGPRLRDGLDRGRIADSLQIGRGLDERARFSGAFARLFDAIDVLLMPVLACGTPTWDEAEALVASGTERVMHFTGFVNACGVPSLTLPCGLTSDGRPVGFQLIGPHLSESTLLRTGHAFQQATDWHHRHPALA